MSEECLNHVTIEHACNLRREAVEQAAQLITWEVVKKLVQRYSNGSFVNWQSIAEDLRSELIKVRVKMSEMEPLGPDCEKCGHSLVLHDDKYGCEFERGDAWVTGRDGTECLMAQGPCGCKSEASHE